MWVTKHISSYFQVKCISYQYIQTVRESDLFTVMGSFHVIVS